MTIDVDALAAAGLYDPTSATATQDLGLLEFLLGQGATLDDLIQGRDDLPLVAFDLMVRPSQDFTIGEVSARSGVPEDLISDIWRASGFTTPDRDRPQFDEGDIEAATMFHLAGQLLGHDTALQLIRVIGAATARIADAMVAAFVANALADSGHPDELQRAQHNALAADIIPPANRFIGLLLRRHLVQMRRPTDVTHAGAGHTVRRLAIGFADLVDSTTLAQQLTLAELGAAISDFEAAAARYVANHDGRVVKVIGDAVMFVAPTVTAACHIGLGVIDAVDAHPILSAVRIGIAYGDLLSHDGDFHGPVVNLAARATKHADPNSIALPDQATNELDQADVDVRPLVTVDLPGIPAPTTLLTVRPTQHTTTDHER